jgi:hypothetical protein
MVQYSHANLSFIGHKNACNIVTEVDRTTRCIRSWAVVWERTWDMLQETIARAAPGQQYYSAAFPTYETLVYYPGHHAVAPGACYGLLAHCWNAGQRHSADLWLRFVQGRPVSVVTIAFLHWRAARAEVRGTRAVAW